MPSITTYQYTVFPNGHFLLRAYKKIFGNEEKNKYMIKNVDDYIFELQQSNYLILENSFHSMYSYYQVMREHIASIQDKI